ncbi:MAG: helix-hairpin-helix domain-containing protein [Cyanobacteria bacterium P01_D01_bin.71]
MANFARVLSELPRQTVRAWRQYFHPLRERLQRDPLARLETAAEVAIAADLGIRIDVNQATVDDWLRLPGISIHQARTLTRLSQHGVVFYALEDVAAALGLPDQRLLPISPVLQFCYYDESSAIAAPGLGSLNQATMGQLMTLPSMSPAIAERIMNERRRSPFTSWSDVHHRLRLTPEQTQQWMHFLTAGK